MPWRAVAFVAIAQAISALFVAAPAGVKYTWIFRRSVALRSRREQRVKRLRLVEIDHGCVYSECHMRLT